MAAGGAAAPGGVAPGALVGLGVHAGVGRAAGGLGRVVVKDAGAGAGLAAASGADGATGGVGLGLAAAGGAASGGLGLAVGGGEAAGAVVGAPAGAGCAPYSASRRAIAWSSAESSPVISASGIGGWMERNWPISALRARS
jgi:hypothetical protein